MIFSYSMITPLKKFGLVIFGPWDPRRLVEAGGPTPTQTPGKRRQRQKNGTAPTPTTKAAAADTERRTTTTQTKKEPGRQAVNIISQANTAGIINAAASSTADTDNILRPIITIMLKALSMFAFYHHYLNCRLLSLRQLQPRYQLPKRKRQASCRCPRACQTLQCSLHTAY